MHGMHARLPKNFVLEERLERYADAIELFPRTWAGRWAQACWPIAADAAAGTGDNTVSCDGTDGGAPAGEGASVDAGTGFHEVRLDLGCGKGAFVVEAATREPQVLFVAMDAEPLCIAYTAQHICEAGLRNAVAVPGAGSLVPEAFGPGEISCIYLNFPTPYPRKRDAHRRLVSFERLVDFRAALRADGTLRLRTDSQPLRDFAKAQLDAAGYDVVWASDDERRDHPAEPTSEYEQRLAKQGARVYALWATPARPAQDEPPAASLSLVDYFPPDLFADGYVPHGMGGAVVNLRNRRKNAAARRTR